MKAAAWVSVIFLLGIHEGKAQDYFVGTGYTSKFIGETIGVDIKRQNNKHAFSGGFVFYLNREPETKYDLYERNYLFCPVHFYPIKDKAYGNHFWNRFGLQMDYSYMLGNHSDIQPYLFLGTTLSNIGFRFYPMLRDPYNEYTVTPDYFIVELFPGIGLNIKLFKSIYLNQSISPGILYINSLKIHSFSSATSLNPEYKIGIHYRF